MCWHHYHLLNRLMTRPGLTRDGLVLHMICRLLLEPVTLSDSETDDSDWKMAYTSGLHCFKSFDFDVTFHKLACHIQGSQSWTWMISFRHGKLIDITVVIKHSVNRFLSKMNHRRMVLSDRNNKLLTLMGITFIFYLFALNCVEK